jgi:hypothetical protein
VAAEIEPLWREGRVLERVGAGPETPSFVIEDNTVFLGAVFAALDFRSTFGGEPGRTPSDCT